eukprot:Gb_17312 [translate_table: standard]
MFGKEAIRVSLYRTGSWQSKVSGQIFPLTAAEQQVVRGVRRRLEADSSDGCASKRRRDALMHPSPFERLKNADNRCLVHHIYVACNMDSSGLVCWTLVQLDLGKGVLAQGNWKLQNALVVKGAFPPLFIRAYIGAQSNFPIGCASEYNHRSQKGLTSSLSIRWVVVPRVPIFLDVQVNIMGWMCEMDKMAIVSRASR